MFRNLKPKLLLLVLTSFILLSAPKAYAYTNLLQRSISIGSSVASANTTHTFSFKFQVSVNVGSIVFQYCNDPISDVTCVNPNGSDVSGAVLDNQSGEVGFAVVNTSTNQITIGRTPSDTTINDNSYQFSNVINPADIGPFYVRISAYSSSDGSGAVVAASSVAASINQGININAEVPQILYFCAAVSIPTDCSDATGDFIEFGILTNKVTKFGTSQFLVGSNAPNGYTVSTNGPTMTSGTDQIAGVNPADISRLGKSQFGLNLAVNTAPNVGSNPTGTGTGAVSPAYNQQNIFKYFDGDVVEASIDRSTIQIFTVSYIVNVSSSQPSGVYNTTITYLCTGGF